ncbi:MAG: hypothetical protein Tsb0021_16770 [Chlamydiales bacterium]
MNNRCIFAFHLIMGVFLCFHQLSAQEETKVEEELVVIDIKQKNPRDVIAFVAQRNNPDFMKKIMEEHDGLKDMKKADQLLQEQDYIPLLKMVWSEKDQQKRNAFLKKASEKGHPIMMLEYSVESLNENPTLEEFIKESQPWMVTGAVRTQQDLVCVENPTALEVIQSIIFTYGVAINTPMEGKYTQEEVLSYIEKNQETALKSVEERMRQSLYQKNVPSPKWITYSSGKDEEPAQLISEDECQERRKEFADAVLNKALEQNPPKQDSHSN